MALMFNRIVISVKKHRWAVLVVLAFFGLAVVYNIKTPIFEAPDELWHYPYVWHIATTRQLPVLELDNPQLWQQEGSQPPLYYVLAALFTATIPTSDLPSLIVPNLHADIGVVKPDGNANIVVHTEQEQWPWQGAVLSIHLARLFSTLLATVTVLATYLLGLTLWPKNRDYALVAMMFVAFNPMFLFISASVNNDNMIVMLATLVLWRLVALTSRQVKPSVWQIVALGVLVGMATLTKFNGLGLLALSGATLLVWGALQRSWRIAIGYNVLFSAIVLLMGGWWYVRNQLLYNDWTGTENIVALMGARSVSPTFLQFMAELAGIHRSFWGLFGYLSVPLPEFLYLFFNIMFFLGLLGWLTLALPFRQNRHKFVPPNLKSTWPILLGWLFLLGVGFLRWTLRILATQGRLLFTAFGPLAVLWTAGWLAIVPRRVAFAIALVMFLIAAWVPWGIIAPAYQRPTPVAQLPPEANPTDATFGEVAGLIGYKLSTSAVRPGQTLDVTLFWQAGESTPTNYSLFLHLVDEQGLIIAQRDIFHGAGLYPTGQWESGVRFADTYTLAVPGTAYAPAKAELVAGLYNRETGDRLRLKTGEDAFNFGRVDLLENAGQVPNPQHLQFADGITLRGYHLDQRVVKPGQTLNVTLYWQAQRIPSQNYKVFVHVVNQAGIRAGQHDSDPQQGAAPTAGWQRDHTTTDLHPVLIAGDAPPGAYDVVVGLYAAETGQRLALEKNGDDWTQADSITLSGIQIPP
jgi:4-amino-4-deoxy-L-arabinose transferase-like glycosyltransferase